VQIELTQKEVKKYFYFGILFQFYKKPPYFIVFIKKIFLFLFTDFLGIFLELNFNENIV
jgi:hypothetical protein